MVGDREDLQSGSIKKDPHSKSSILGDHGKLWINLKTSPLDDDEEEGGLEEDKIITTAKDQKQLQNNNITRICHVCNKGFRSGKALGGHMRIHFQANKEPTFSKNLIKPSQSIKFKKQKREISDVTKKKDPKKSSSNGEIAAAADGFDKNNPTCLLCGKNFPSMKSLFGHMRCHPDRAWRGIQPPPAAKVSPLSSVADAEPEPRESDDDEEDQAVDLTKLLCGWSVTAKRGRKAIAFSLEDEGMRDAVYHLMSLAKGDSCQANKQHRVEEEFEATNSNSLAHKTGNGEITKRVPRSKKGRQKDYSAGFIKVKDHPAKELRNEERKKIDITHMGNGNTIQETDVLAGNSASLDCQWEGANWPKEYCEDRDCYGYDSEDSENTHDDVKLLNHKSFESSNGNVNIVKNSKKKKRKKMKLRDLESVHDASPVHQNQVLTMINSPEKYRCNTCDKCFQTYQALGGHRSSHNKFRMIIHNSVDESTSAADEDENLADYFPTPVEESKESEEAASSKLMDGTHQCKTCDKNFPTGQALGGQKRCHWTGLMDVLSSQEVSHTGRRVMEFDLNEVPPMEELDAGMESDHASGGYGYATYSYNSVQFPVF